MPAIFRSIRRPAAASSSPSRCRTPMPRSTGPRPTGPGSACAAFSAARKRRSTRCFAPSELRPLRRSVPAQPELRHADHRAGIGHRWLGGIDAELGNALQPFLDEDDDLHPREMLAGAFMRAVAEGVVGARVAVVIDRPGIV